MKTFKLQYQDIIQEVRAGDISEARPTFKKKNNLPKDVKHFDIKWIKETEGNVDAATAEAITRSHLNY